VIFKRYIEDFLKEVTEKEFGLPFDKISLVQLIENIKLRRTIQKAEKSFGDGRYKRCIDLCKKAFGDAFDATNVSKKAGILTGYFAAVAEEHQNELIKIINKSYLKKYKQKEIRILAKELGEAVLQIAQASTVMQFLDEYKSDFIKFISIDIKTIPSKQHKDYAQFSLDFVISLILKWQNDGLFKKKKIIKNPNRR
jgi:hypothetical protein